MGKTAILVGTSGLGRSLMHPLAALGFDRVLLTYYHDAASADAWKQEAEQLGIAVTIKQLDATDSVVVALTIRYAKELFNQIDAVIALQGAFLMKSPLNYSDAEWHTLFANNVDANYFLARETIPYLRETTGSLLFFGVAHADQLHSQSQTMPYSAAKTALLVMMKTLARTEAPNGVRVNMISPGLMQNGKMSIDMEYELAVGVPAKRCGTPEDINHAVQFLLADENRYVTGTNLVVSGGWAI